MVPGQLATEEDDAPENPMHPRVSEPVALWFADRGVRVSVVRLAPSVHGEGDYAFIPAVGTTAWMRSVLSRRTGGILVLAQDRKSTASL